MAVNYLRNLKLARLGAIRVQDDFLTCWSDASFQSVAILVFWSLPVLELSSLSWLASAWTASKILAVLFQQAQPIAPISRGGCLQFAGLLSPSLLHLLLHQSKFVTWGHHGWFPSPSFLHIELWQFHCLNRSFLPLCGLHPEEGVPNCEELQQLHSTTLQLVCWEESWSCRNMHRRLDDNLLHGSSQVMFANYIGGSIDRGLFGTVPCPKFHCHILDMLCWTCLGGSSLAATTGYDEGHWRKGSCEHWAPIADDVGGSSLFFPMPYIRDFLMWRFFHPQCFHSRKLLEDTGFAALGTWPRNVLLQVVLHDLLRHDRARIAPTILPKLATRCTDAAGTRQLQWDQMLCHEICRQLWNRPPNPLKDPPINPPTLYLFK